MPIPASALIGAGLGVVQTALNIGKQAQAKKEIKRLQANRPLLKASPFAKDQLSLAESELQQGMSADSENAFNQSTDRDLSTTLDAVLRGGGSVNNVAEVFDRSQVGRQRLSLMQDNLRLSQINNLARARDASEDDRLQRFQYNEYAPWADQMAAASGAAGRAEDRIWGGINTAGSSFMQGLQTSENNKQLNDFFNAGNSGFGGGDSSFRSSTVKRAPMATATKSPANDFSAFLNPNYGSALFQ